MAITLTGGNGLFDRIGKIGRMVNLVNRWCGNAGVTLAGSEITTDLPSELVAIQGVGSDLDMVLRELYWSLGPSFTQCISANESLLSKLLQTAQSALIRQVVLDKPLAANTLENALIELISQMQSGGDYVSDPTIAATVTAGGSNVGNGKLTVSLRTPDGYDSDNVLGETISCAATSPTRLQLRGAAPVSSTLSYTWPGGSGCSRTLSAVSPGDSADKLANGGFEAFSPADTPTSWTIDTGTVGTTLLEETSTKFAGSSALRFSGNGSQLTSISQVLSGLSSRTPYAFNIWMRNSTNPAAGALAIDLYDGSGVINDEAGNANSFTVDLTTLGTTFVAKNFTFRLPEPVPASVRLRIRLTTAITNTHSLYLDSACLQAASELYDQGPWVAAFAGSTPFSLDDTFDIAVTNDRAGKFQEMFERLFSMRSKGLLLPTTGSNAISDTLLD